MPNDAKLGLLTGVLGVIVVAVLSVQRPATTPAASAPPQQQTVATNTGTKMAPAPTANARNVSVPDAPEVLPTDLPSTPVVRTRKEPDATPTSRARNDDDIDP